MLRAPHTEIKWQEPYRESVAASWQELIKSGLLRFSLWMRVLLITAAIIGACIAWFYWLTPNIVIPWRQLALGFFVFPPVLLLSAILSVCLAPKYIRLRDDRILIAHGQSGLRIDPDQIQHISIESTQSPPRLSIAFTTRRQKPRTLSIAIASNVDLSALQSLIQTLNATTKQPNTDHAPAPQ